MRNFVFVLLLIVGCNYQTTSAGSLVDSADAVAYVAVDFAFIDLDASPIPKKPVTPDSGGRGAYKSPAKAVQTFANPTAADDDCPTCPPAKKKPVRRAYFYSATWCEPCIPVQVALKRIAKEKGLKFGEYNDRASDDVEHVDIDRDKIKKKILDVPTLIIYDGLEEVWRGSGKSDLTYGAMKAAFELPSAVKDTPPKVSMFNKMQGIYQSRWSWPGKQWAGTCTLSLQNLESHLHGSIHHLNTEGMTYGQMLQYHDSWHSTYGPRSSRPETAARGAAQSSTSSRRIFSFRSGNCPNGRCPTRRRA
jgi:thiol-disulfide isomerase/thioredoxin